jgi:hypothetical protein
VGKSLHSVCATPGVVCLPGDPTRQDFRLSIGLLVLGGLAEVLSRRLIHRVVVRLERFVDPGTQEEYVDVFHMTHFGRARKTFKREGACDDAALCLS